MKIKKQIAILLSTIMMMSAVVPVLGADGVIRDGRTLVPVRGVFESLGFSVDWDDSTNTASISDSSHKVSLKKGLDYFTADEKEIRPDVPQQIIDDRFYLPLRAIGDAVGAETIWNEENKAAHISYNGKEVTVYCDPSKKPSDNTQNTSTNNPESKPDEKPATHIDSPVNKPTTPPIKFYSAFPDVPDFGAVYGISPLLVTDSSFTYTITSMSEYISVLQSCGFVYSDILSRALTEVASDSSSAVSTYIKNNTTVSLAYEYGMTCVVIMPFDGTYDSSPKIKYYSKYPDVPDFGAVYGISPILETEKGFGYNAVSPDPYIEVLESCGYVGNYQKSLELSDDDSITLVYEKGSRTVAFGYSHSLGYTFLIIL